MRTFVCRSSNEKLKILAAIDSALVHKVLPRLQRTMNASPHVRIVSEQQHKQQYKYACNIAEHCRTLRHFAALLNASDRTMARGVGRSGGAAQQFRLSVSTPKSNRNRIRAIKFYRRSWSCNFSPRIKWVHNERARMHGHNNASGCGAKQDDAEGKHILLWQMTLLQMLPLSLLLVIAVVVITVVAVVVPIAASSRQFSKPIILPRHARVVEYRAGSMYDNECLLWGQAFASERIAKRKRHCFRCCADVDVVAVLYSHTKLAENI